MATVGDAKLIKKVQSLLDLTAQVTMHAMPSVLISSPYDRRIDKLSESQSQPFTVRSEVAAEFMVIVNPKKTTGIFFWKKPSRLILSADRWVKIESGNESLTSEERIFIQEL